MVEPDIFERHIGKAPPIELDGDEFHLVPLGTEFGPALLNVQFAFMAGMPDGLGEEEIDEKSFGLKEIKQVFGGIDDKAKQDMYYLIRETLKRSYPDKDIDVLDKFGMKYGLQLIMHIININSGIGESSHEKVKIARIRARLNESVKTNQEQQEKSAV